MVPERSALTRLYIHTHSHTPHWHSHTHSLHRCTHTHNTGGWWHLNWGGRARGNSFHVSDAMPFAPFQPLLCAVLLSSLHCYTHTYYLSWCLVTLPCLHVHTYLCTLIWYWCSLYIVPFLCILFLLCYCRDSSILHSMHLHLNIFNVWFCDLNCCHSADTCINLVGSRIRTSNLSVTGATLWLDWLG
jgi:hypothetical protein